MAGGPTCRSMARLAGPCPRRSGLCRTRSLCWRRRGTGSRKHPSLTFGARIGAPNVSGGFSFSTELRGTALNGRPRFGSCLAASRRRVTSHRPEPGARQVPRARPKSPDYRLLAAPRILACILMVPLLTLAADFCGLVMGWVTQALVEPVSLHQFINAGFSGADFNDFLPPTFKTTVFGLIIGLIACFQGMRTQGGAVGVGRAATSSVVLSSLFVILADVVLVKIIILFFP